MSEKTEEKEETGSKKDSLLPNESFTKGRQGFINPVIENARSFLKLYGIRKEPDTFRFFKSIPTDPVGKRFYSEMSAHQSLPYNERLTKEVASGIAMGITNIPICMALLHLEKRLYPPGTPLGLPCSRFHDMNFRFYARFSIPIIEELIYRGALLYGFHAGFTKSLGVNDSHAAILSSAVNSLIFSALHSKGLRLPTFFAGMMYSGMTYYCDGSLVPAITAHMTNNNMMIPPAPRRLWIIR